MSYTHEHYSDFYANGQRKPALNEVAFAKAQGNFGTASAEDDARLYRAIQAYEEVAHAAALERVSALEDRERTFRALIADDDYCANINSADELRKDLLGWIDEENAIDPKGPPDYRSAGGQS